MFSRISILDFLITDLEMVKVSRIIFASVAKEQRCLDVVNTCGYDDNQQKDNSRYKII